MNLKNIKVIGVFGIFLLTILFHFLYEWFPNIIFSIIFPVNESIWEHMKLLYSGFFFFGLIEYFLLKKFSITANNFWYCLFLCMITSIMTYLIIYLPIYNLFGENLIVSIILLAFIIVLEQIFSYYLLKCESNKKILAKISIILIILGYIVFASLTYDPPKNYIFYDTNNNKYGIDISE